MLHLRSCICNKTSMLMRIASSSLAWCTCSVTTKDIDRRTHSCQPPLQFLRGMCHNASIPNCIWINVLGTRLDHWSCRSCNVASRASNSSMPTSAASDARAEATRNARLYFWSCVRAVHQVPHWCPQKHRWRQMSSSCCEPWSSSSLTTVPQPGPCRRGPSSPHLWQQTCADMVAASSPWTYTCMKQGTQPARLHLIADAIHRHLSWRPSPSDGAAGWRMQQRRGSDICWRAASGHHCLLS